MILLTAEYLTDGHEKLYRICQLFVAVLFAVLSGGWWGFLAIAAIVNLKLLPVCLTSGIIYTVYSSVHMILSGTFGRYNIARMVLGLFLIEAIFVIYSVKSVELVNALTYGGRSACEYPVDIFPRPLRILFTAVAPFALVLHVPSAWILGKPLYGWPAWTAFVCPLAGIAFFLAIYCLFRVALRHYRSTGS